MLLNKLYEIAYIYIVNKYAASELLRKSVIQLLQIMRFGHTNA